MFTVPADEFEQYICWAKANVSNQVYPLSIAEGRQSGCIYTDRADAVDADGADAVDADGADFVDADGADSMNAAGADTANAVLFWHYCGFGYLSGNPQASFLDEIYDEFFLKEQKRRFVLITDDPDVIQYFSGKQGVSIGTRIEYRFPETKPDLMHAPMEPEFHIPAPEKHILNPEPHIPAPASQILPPGYQIRKIDRAILSRLRGHIIPPFSWDSAERFLENGFGYAVMEGETIASAAFSASVSSDETDIGVETMEAFRGKGFAKAAAGAMVQEILRQGKRPVWAHSEQNQASGALARSLGFAVCKQNAVIRKT